MTWTRSRRARVCGRCGASILAGAVYAAIGIGRVAKVRCAACAGDPVPPDLPAHVELEDLSARLQRLGLLPLDWVRPVQALHEREPGEEG